MVVTSDAPMTTGIVTHESSTTLTIWFCCHPASSFCYVCDRPYLLFSEIVVVVLILFCIGS
jgi:hypothetical protein